VSDLAEPEMSALLDGLAALYYVEHDVCIWPTDDYGRAWPDTPCTFDTVPLDYAREVAAKHG
jgi:hypothetical protein